MESGMLKVKTFQKKIINSKKLPVEEMATVIDQWQDESNISRIISIETQSLGGGYGPLLLVATVWYEGEPDVVQKYTNEEVYAMEQAALARKDELPHIKAKNE